MKRATLALVGAGLLGGAFTASASVGNDVFTTFALPQGDAIYRSYRPGYGFSYDKWYEANGNPVGAYHIYEYGTGDNANAFVEFSIGGFDDEDIVSVVLQIHVTSLWDDGDGIYASLSHHTGAALTGNAVADWGKLSTSFITHLTPSNTTLGWNAYDVTDQVLADLAAGRTWSGWYFGQDGYSGVMFASGDAGMELAPRLTAEVVSTPLPGAALLLGSSLLGLGVIRRRAA